MRARWRLNDAITPCMHAGCLTGPNFDHLLSLLLLCVRGVALCLA